MAGTIALVIALVGGWMQAGGVQSTALATTFLAGAGLVLIGAIAWGMSVRLLPKLRSRVVAWVADAMPPAPDITQLQAGMKRLEGQFEALRRISPDSANPNESSHAPGDQATEATRAALRLAGTKIAGELDYIDDVIHHTAADYFMRGLQLPNEQFVKHGDALAEASPQYRAVNAAYGVADAINIAAGHQHDMEMIPSVSRSLLDRWDRAFTDACAALDRLEESYGITPPSS